MAEHPQAESPRYMEIKFKAQHSKWLRRSISDVNVRLKAISKLVEEDADSFASRAEMYFKNRPRLMELVEELYQAYHTLAEQYNQATRALHQTNHRVIEAFSSKLVTAKIPDVTELDTLQKDATIIFISDMDAKLKTTIKLLEEVADSFAKRAEMYYKHRPKLKKLVEEFYQAYCTLAEQYDTVANVLRQVLHTISDAFLRETPTPLSELDVHDLSSFTSGSCSEHELQSDESTSSHNKNAVKRSATFPEEKWLAESSQLTKEIDNLKEQLSSENNRANKAESEVATLKASIGHLSVARDAAKAECQAYSEKIEKLESELLKAQNDINVLADGWAKEVRNLQSTDKVKQSQKQELDDLKHRLRELEARQLEPERNRSKKKEEEDMLKVSELMEELERSKIQAQTIIWKLEKEIERLHEQNVSSEILISELENKTILLTDTNERLESEIEILRERLWMYFGKQEKLIFAGAPHSGANVQTSSNSYNCLSVLCDRLHHVLLPLKSSIRAFLFSLVKVVLYVYTKFFTTQNSSEKIIKEDDQCRKKLLQKVEKPEKNVMQEHRLYKMRVDEMDENEEMSEEDDWRNSKTILEDYKDET